MAKKDITLATLARQMEKGFADTGEAINKLADGQDALTDAVKGVQARVAQLENQTYELRIEVQGIKRIVTPYDTVHKAFARDISELKKRVRALEGTKR